LRWYLIWSYEEIASYSNPENCKLMPHLCNVTYLTNKVVVSICLWEVYGLILGVEHDPYIYFM
jgi:hypothetical protein